MASVNFFGINTDPSVECEIVAGSFAPNGSSALSTAGVKGIGFTVARTSAGVFTVTLNKSYTALVAGNLILGLQTASSAATKNSLEFGAIDVVTAKTVVIRNTKAVLYDRTTPATSTALTTAVADISAHADNRIHFFLILQK